MVADSTETHLLCLALSLIQRRLVSQVAYNVRTYIYSFEATGIRSSYCAYIILIMLKLSFQDTAAIKAALCLKAVLSDLEV